MPTRKHLTPQEKTQIVLAVLREEKSVVQLASEHGIHANQIYKWKNQVVENLAQLFEDDRKQEQRRLNEHQRQLQELYAEIGRLTTQLSWLKKKSGINHE